MKYFFFSVVVLCSFNAYSYEYLVKSLRGNVTQEKSGKKIKENDELHFNDVISTSEKSFLQIVDAKGGKISIGPNSKVELIKEETQNISALAIIKGQVRATFQKNENNKYKFFIKSRSAALGVRGTDFHFIYNPENNVSTVLTYEGKVDFKENPTGESISSDDFEKGRVIKIPKGYISGVFYNDAKASSPIKISPLQFALLETNQELKEGTGQKVTRPKESKLTTADPTKTIESDLATKDENIIPIPKKFIDDEYFEDKVRGNLAIKGGGYLDLKTGIYIHPPENSEYDAENDLYYPPIEFGGIDEESGEYVAPPGLILHPLKGFMFTSNILQKGFHNVTSTVTNVITPISDTMTSAGVKTYDTIKDSAQVVRDNTGVVGSTVGAGVDLVGTGVSKTLDLAGDTSSLILNKTANSLNYVIHDTFLTRIKSIKECVPLVNYLKIKFTQNFEYAHVNVDKYNMYDRNVVRNDAVNSQTNLDFKVQKSFYSNFFVRPHFELRNKNYLGDNTNLKSFDQITYYVGSDFGYSTTVKEMKYQTYLSIEKGKTRKAEAYKENFLTNEDTWRFGFTKLILGQKIFSTTLDYHYEKYSGPFDGKGSRHHVKISEILSINDDRFVRLSADWNRILQEKYGATNNWSTKLNFFMTTLKWNMNFDFWAGLRFLDNTGTLEKRSKEVNYFAGSSLTKSFENNFSVQFNYELLKQTSPDARFKYLAQSFSSGINYIF